jgi:hypothetical protein
MAEHLNPAYYSKRLIRTDYKEDPSAWKPTGLAGFDQVVLHARDRPGAMPGTQNELYVMRRGLPANGEAISELEIGLDNFFEPCGDPQIDAAHQEARTRGELVGYTRLGKLKVLGIDLWSSCGLWPSKKATHKGGLGKRSSEREAGGGRGRDAPGDLSPSGVADGESDKPIYAGSVDLPDGPSGSGLKRKADHFEAENAHVPRDKLVASTSDLNQPPEHKAIDAWKFPAKRILVQVDLPARFWGDSRGTRLYVDFRSQESKDTKRHRELGAIPDGEEGAIIQRDRDAAAVAAQRALRGCFRPVNREVRATSPNAAAAAASSTGLPAAEQGASPDGNAASMANGPPVEDSGSAINALTALAGIAV